MRKIIKISAPVFAVVYAMILISFAADKVSRTPSQATRDAYIERSGFENYGVHSRSADDLLDAAQAASGVSRSSQEMTAACTSPQFMCPVRLECATNNNGYCSVCGDKLGTGGHPDALSTPLGDGVTELLLLSSLYFIAVLVRKYRLGSPPSRG